MPISNPPNSSLNFSEKQPILQAQVIPTKSELLTTKPIVPPADSKVETNNLQKYTDFLRQKFWQNLKGEMPSGREGRALPIRLGIDLGTSFSKVVYRLGNESFPVRFGANKNKVEDYLLPSVVVIGGKAIKCRFEFENEDKLKKAAFIPNFKICLTCESGDETIDGCSITKCRLSNLKPGYLPKELEAEEAMFLNVFYLAKLIVQTKKAVRQQLPERQIPSDMPVRWSANMAVPDKYLDSNVAESFRRALETAWLMYEIFPAQPDLSSKSEIINCYLAAKKLREEIKRELLSKGEDFDCSIYSEIGAEVASVTLSPTSEEGLYVFVDVGAGTIDTSVFRFHRVDGEPRQLTYAASVFKLGAAQIDARANSSFSRKSLNWLRQIKENILRLDKDEILSSITEEIKIAENEVTEEARDKLIAVFKEAFGKQNNVAAWTNLKLVMGGGGSSIQSYIDVARQSFSLKTTNTPQVETTVLKVPSDFNLDTLPANQFHRFAVAYGLSRSNFELPELVAPHQIKPMGDLQKRVYEDPTNDG